MSNSISDCKHLNQVICEREGNIVCTDCCLVTSDHIYLDKSDFFHTNQKYETQNEILEILERLNLSQTHAESIKKNMFKLCEEKKTSEKTQMMF